MLNFSFSVTNLTKSILKDTLSTMPMLKSILNIKRSQKLFQPEDFSTLLSTPVIFLPRQFFPFFLFSSKKESIC